MYKPVRLDARDRVVRLGAQGKAEQQLGGAERLGGSERRLGGSERRLGRAGEAAELCGAAELLGAQGKAEQWLGRAEWLGGAGEAAELCGVAELLGVPLTPMSHKDDTCSAPWAGTRALVLKYWATKSESSPS